MSSLEEFTVGVSRFKGPECSIPGAFIHQLEGAGRMQRHTKTVILALCAALWVAPTIWAQAAAPKTPAAPAAPAPGAKKPKAAAVEPIKDVGNVAKGEKITNDFMIKNEGDADLQITNVQPACGCTVADFDKVIKPGQ